MPTSQVKSRVTSKPITFSILTQKVEFFSRLRTKNSLFSELFRNTSDADVKSISVLLIEVKRNS